MLIGLEVGNHLFHSGILPNITPIELGQEVERVEVFGDFFNLADPSLGYDYYMIYLYIDHFDIYIYNLNDDHLFSYIGSMHLQRLLTKSALVLSKPFKAFQIFQSKAQGVSP